MKYLVRFVGHVIEQNRPEGFPQEVWTDINVETTDMREIQKVINSFLSIMVRQRGMVVDKEGRIRSAQQPLKPDSTMKDFDTRVFVPYHMLSYIETVTRLISAENVSESEEEGEDEVPPQIPIQ